MGFCNNNYDIDDINENYNDIDHYDDNNDCNPNYDKNNVRKKTMTLNKTSVKA